ncbi:MAG: matrixin family metalloprotease [Pirellulales bacterium]|nr:matrixin family metalloprotease [Pirellulales bacterium]
MIARIAWLRSCLMLAIALACARAANATVVVMSNRSAAAVPFSVSQSIERDGKSTPVSRKFNLGSGELLPIAVLPHIPISLDFESAGHPLHYNLEGDSTYYFANTTLGGVNLEQIGIPQVMQVESEVTAATSAAHPRKRLPGLATIPVKLLVDDDERSSRDQWEPRVRKRLAAASKILEHVCRMRFEAVAVETWDSDDKVNDFNQSLAEFEHEVLPAPGRLVIGFTSQYEDTRGPTKLGGTRAAFYPYILLREWSKYYAEPERLELLVHELGHYLGAVHSPEPNSVMRPMLGDKRSRLKAFQINFDPVNALAMYLIGEEYRARGNVRKLTELTPVTRRKLFNIYSEINRALPGDPAAEQYLMLLGDVSHLSEEMRRKLNTSPAAR